MGIVNCHGFENGALLGGMNQFNAGGVPVSILGAAAHNGSYGLRIATTSGGSDQSYWQTRTVEYHSGNTNSNIVVVSCAIRFNTLPNADRMLIAFRPLGGSFVALNFNQAAPGFSLTDGSTGVGGPTVTTGVWYIADLRVNTSASTWTVDWRINGTAQTQGTWSKSPDNNQYYVQLGDHNVATITQSIDFDDLVISITSGDYPLGEHIVRWHAINGPATHVLDASPSLYAFYNSGSGDTAVANTTETSSYLTIDDTPPNTGTTDWIGYRTDDGSSTQTDILPDAVLASSGYNTIPIGSIDEDPDSPDGLWGGATANSTDTDVRVSFPTPSGPPATTGNLVIDAYVRKQSLGGSGNGTPTARIELWYNGSQIAVGSENNITNTTGQKITASFSMATYGSSLGTGTALEARVYGTAVGGNPNNRATVEVGAVDIASFPYQTQPSTSQYLAYNFVDALESTGADGVVVRWTHAKGASTSASLEYRIYSGSNFTTVYPYSLGMPANVHPSLAGQAYSLSTDPGGGSWSSTLLNGLQLRVGYTDSVAAQARVYMFGIEASFPAAAPPTQLHQLIQPRIYPDVPTQDRSRW